MSNREREYREEIRQRHDGMRARAYWREWISAEVSAGRDGEPSESMVAEARASRFQREPWGTRGGCPRVAVLCPGPSLPKTWRGQPYDAVVAVNRAADRGCDWLAAYDWQPIVGNMRHARQGIVTLAGQVKQLSGTGDLQILDVADVLPKGLRYVSMTFSKLGAMALAGWLGADTVDVYGDDMHGGRYFDGEECASGGGKNGWMRWARESELTAMTEAHLKAEGLCIRRPVAPMFVSFGTPEYEAELAGLIESLQAHELEHDCEILPSLGSWAANCQRKAEFLLSKLDEHKRPIVWVDADARIVRDPWELRFVDGDIGFHSLRGRELLTGTLYVNDTEPARRVLRDWSAENATNPRQWDQRTLAAVIARGTYARIDRLPLATCQIFDHPEQDPSPAIVHHQASRRMRSVVNTKAVA